MKYNGVIFLPELNFSRILNEGFDFVVVSVGQVRNGDDEQEGEDDADGANDQERQHEAAHFVQPGSNSRP